MNKFGTYDAGTILMLVIGVACILSRNTFVIVVGCVILLWRFGLGGIDGGAPGGAWLSQYIPPG
jgi:hypothetical protein